MAIIVRTITNFPLNGSSREFDIAFDYLARRFVKVAVIGGEARQELTLGVDFRFVTKTKIRTTQSLGSPWERIEIRRETSATDRIVNFADGSILRAKDLNASQIQAIHVAEESRDLASLSVTEDDLGDLDAKNRRVKNVADPVADSDAATKGYTDISLSKAIRVGYQIPVMTGDLAGRLLSFDSSGYPVAVIPSVSSEVALAALLRSNEGASNIGTSLGVTVEESLNQIEEVSSLNTRELWERILDGRGYNLVGSFGNGYSVSTDMDVAWDVSTGQCYKWTGSFPKEAIEATEAGWLKVHPTILKRFDSYTKLLAATGIVVGDIVSTGTGTWEVIKVPLSSVQDLKMLEQPSLYDFGAVGGDSVKDSLAFFVAFGLNVPFKVPAVPLSKAFVVTGELDVPRVSRMSGEGVAVSPYQTVLRTEDVQAWITFKDKDSRFTIGRSTADRSFLYWDNIAFVSHVGIAPADDMRSGEAIGAKTGYDAAAGGNCSNLSFYGFERAFRNDWAYYFHVSNITVIACDKGLEFDDWNSSSITNFLSTATKFPIDTGLDSAQSAMTNIGINMSKQTYIGVRCGGGVSFSGHCYFESIGDLPIFEDQTCIAYQVNRYSQRTLDLKNVLFDARNAGYLLTLDGINTDEGNFVVPALVSLCKFVAPKKAKVGFGIHADRMGRPTHANFTLSKWDLATCFGLTEAELRLPANSPYRKWDQRPYVNFLLNNVAIDVSSAIFTNLPASKTTGTLTSNIEAATIVLDDGRIQVPKSGLYFIQFNAILRNSTSAPIAKTDLQVRMNDTTIIIAATSIPNVSGLGHVYTTVGGSCITELVAGSYIRLRAANGGLVYGYSISVNHM